MYKNVEVRQYRSGTFLIELYKKGVNYYYQREDGTLTHIADNLRDCDYTIKAFVFESTTPRISIPLISVDTQTLLSLMDNTKRFAINTASNILDFPEGLFTTILTKIVTNTCIKKFSYHQQLGRGYDNCKLITEIFKHNETLRQIWSYPKVMCHVDDIAKLYHRSKIHANIDNLDTAIYAWWLNMIDEILENPKVTSEDHIHCAKKVLKFKYPSGISCGRIDMLLNAQRTHGEFLRGWLSLQI